MWIAVFLLNAGVAMIVLSLFLVASLALKITGCVVTILGLVLLTLVLVASRNLRVLVTFDEEGYNVDGPSGEFFGSWIDVTDVSVSRKNAKIALWHGPNRRTVIAHPAHVMDEDFQAIRREIRAHLDTFDD